MEQQGFLIGFAQLALVLTGFVSVFVVFLMDDKEKSRVNTHHTVSILVGSIISLAAALIPVVLFNYGLQGENLWWWSSAGFVVLSVGYFVTMLSMSIQLTKSQFAEAGYLHMASSYGLGTIAACILVWNLVAQPIPGHYVLALIVNLLVPLIAFVTFAAQKVLYW